jgi:hypothetical protein
MWAAVMSVDRPDSTGEIRGENPSGRATARTLLPWQCALPEYHKLLTSPLIQAVRGSSG